MPLHIAFYCGYVSFYIYFNPRRWHLDWVRDATMTTWNFGPFMYYHDKLEYTDA